MARIRSVHPGQATDEDFLELSIPAKLATILIRNEADDNGVFEWKPKTLKARIFPADDVDMATLLTEMEAHRQVTSYELGGRKYGVVRNFRRYQRPKKPNSIHPFPERFRKYAGFKDDDGGSEPEPDDDDAAPVPNQFGISAADEGGRRKEVSSTSSLRSEAPAPAKLTGKPKPGIGDLKAEDFSEYCAERAPLADVAVELERFRNWSKAKGKAHKDAAAAFRNWIIGAPKMAGYGQGQPLAAVNGHSADPAEAQRQYRLRKAREHTAGRSPTSWRRLIEYWRANPKDWPGELSGPPPDHPDCICPPEILAEFGYGPDAPLPRNSEAMA